MIDAAIRESVLGNMYPTNDTPVEIVQSHGVGNRFDEMALYVTRCENPEYNNEFVATVTSVTVTPSGHGFLTRNEPFRRVFGAPLNPVPINGHYYRALGGFLLQYFDEDHLRLRNRADSAWNVIQGADGEPWYIANDSLEAMNMPYIEVQAPDVTDVRDIPEAEQLTPHVVSDTSAAGPTFGLAMPENDGTVLLDPTPLHGTSYITWYGDDVPAEAHVGTFDDTEMRLRIYSHVRRTGGELLYSRRSDTARLDNVLPRHWAKARFLRPEPVPDDNRLGDLVLQLAQLQEQFADTNEALNEKADEESWCEEYDSIMERIGMESRQDKEEDYDVPVNVDFTMTDTTTSGSLDSELGDHYGIEDLTVNELQITGNTSVTISRTARDASGAEYNIDSDDVECELQAHISSSVSINIDDYSVGNAELSD